MGKLVTFWSPYQGCAKVTSSLCAVVGIFGIQYPELTVAVSHCKQNSMELEEKLDSYTTEKIRSELYQRTGIAALKLNCRQASLTSDKIRRSAITLGMKSIYLYPNAEQELDVLTFRLLTETLKKEFDITFLDVESGLKENSLNILKVSDLIVVVLPQSPEYWERFNRQELEILQRKKYGILFGGYIGNSKYSSKYYERKKDWKGYGEIFGAVPINTGFFDAMAEGKTLDYFFRNQWTGKKEENYEFIFETKKAVERIRKSLFLS